MSSGTRLWTVLDLLRWTTDHFASKDIDTARLDAECLLAHALGTDRLRLYLDYDKPVVGPERARFRHLVKRRAEDRVPVAQLTGLREFWSLPLRVTPDVLVPRPETETLVEVALDRIGGSASPPRVLDLGTGSGAVALALAKELPQARITASDISAAALQVARGNARALGLAERVGFVCGDGLASLAVERFDLVVSNPPYLAEDEAPGLPPELAHEPGRALFAGPDGTAVLCRLAREGPERLVQGGVLAVEIASPQATVVSTFFARAGFEDIRVHRDLAGRPRVVSGVRPRAAGPGAAVEASSVQEG